MSESTEPTVGPKSPASFVRGPSRCLTPLAMACAQRGLQLLSCEGYLTDLTVSKPRCDQFMYDDTAKQLTGVITVPQYVQQSQRRIVATSLPSAPM
jgi:hypothetical protein